MELTKLLTKQFDNLVSYAENINRLNCGSATAMVVIQDDTIVTESYSGFHSQLPCSGAHV